MRRFLGATFLIILLPTQTFASVLISSLLPNPSGDDTLGEYIELKNTGCEDADISGYTLSDLSGKTYRLPIAAHIANHANLRLSYSETKIVLNNTGNESVYLKDPSGKIVDTYSYSGTQKDDVVLKISTIDDTCSPVVNTDSSSTGTTMNSGTVSSSGNVVGSGILIDTGSYIDSGILVNTGILQTGSGNGVNFISTGATTENTGILLSLSGELSGSGFTESANMLTGILTSSGNIIENTGIIVSHTDIALETNTGIVENTWATSTSTGVTETYTGSPLSDAGSGISQNTGSTNTGETLVVPYIETGSLTPIEMYYSDQNNNKKIDTLEIIYPYILTGRVNTGSIFLYSATGGLSTTRINSLTGYIISGTLSRNILILELREGDIEKSLLKVNNTTSSELRLKSSGDLGFSSLGGQIPEDFFLTKSFSDYKNVYKKDVSSGDQSSSDTGTLETTGSGVSLSGLVIALSGATNSGDASSFPLIFPTIQEPTNATFSGDTFDCGTHYPCRINVSFLPIFTGGYLEKNYICEVMTSSEMRTTCNPDTFYFATGDTLSLTLKKKSNPDEFIKKEWKIHFTDIVSSGSIISNSGIENTGSANLDLSASIPIVFPDIKPTLQSPTNANLSGDIFVCTFSDCRINITLEPIFSSGFVMRDYMCYFGTGGELILDTDCNPTTIYYTSTGTLNIELVSKKDSTQKSRKIYSIYWNVALSGGKSNTLNGVITLDTGKPVARLKIDGKWKEYYDQKGDYEMNCYTDTCSLNWTAEDSYDPEGSPLRWLWIYGPNEISTSKDPGTRKYDIGDHTMILRVIDFSGNYDEIRYVIHVLGPKPKTEKIKTKKEKISKQSEQKEISAKIIKKKKPKKIKMVFFSPPSLMLQGKTGEKISDTKYICEYKKGSTCSINFTLSGALKGYEYTWKIDGVQVVKGKNPTAWKLSSGNHILIVYSYRKGATDILHEFQTNILVSQAPKKMKPKKTKKQKGVKIPNIIDSAYADDNLSDTDEGNPWNFGFLIFTGGIMLGYVIQRKRRKESYFLRRDENI